MRRICVLMACVTVLNLVSGCNPPAAPLPVASSANDKPKADEHAHSHGAGPHGGTLTDWGGGAYHVEFTVDHDKKEATVYLLGSDEKTPAPIKASSIKLVINDPMSEIELTAKPIEAEAEGTSSRFVGTHETIGMVKEFAGTISGEIEGTPYTGDFKEEPHDAEHKH